MFHSKLFSKWIQFFKWIELREKNWKEKILTLMARRISSTSLSFVSFPWRNLQFFPSISVRSYPVNLQKLKSTCQNKRIWFKRPLHQNLRIRSKYYRTILYIWVTDTIACILVSVAIEHGYDNVIHLTQPFRWNKLTSGWRFGSKHFILAQMRKGVLKKI